MNMRLTAIQRFCLHDGPGIRTTVFLKGCALRCPWCSNPENISYEILTGKSNTVYGTDMDIDEIVRICLKDKAYYEENGGVTVSGGEALLQADEVAVLFDKLHSENIGCCIETSLMAPVDNLNKLIDKTDYWFVDMKLLDAAKAGSILNGDTCLYDTNLDILFKKVSKEKICIRIPLAAGITYTKENIMLLENKLSELNPYRCEIFSVHDLGRKKYEDLDMEFTEFEKIEESELRAFADRLSNRCKDTEIEILRI